MSADNPNIIPITGNNGQPPFTIGLVHHEHPPVGREIPLEIDGLANHASFRHATTHVTDGFTDQSNRSPRRSSSRVRNLHEERPA